MLSRVPKSVPGHQAKKLHAVRGRDRELEAGGGQRLGEPAMLYMVCNVLAALTGSEWRFTKEYAADEDLFFDHALRHSLRRYQ